MLIFILASISCVAASDINTTTDNVLVDTSESATLKGNSYENDNSIQDSFNTESNVLTQSLYENDNNKANNIQNSLDASSDVVYLNNTTYNADKLLNITSKNISVNGSNESGNGFSSFEGSSSSNGTLLNITDHSNVTLSNIIFQNFNNTAIKIDNSNVTFISCLFIGNTITDGDGGAIYVNGGTVTFNNCNFTNNKAISSDSSVQMSKLKNSNSRNDDGEGPNGVNPQGGAISLNNTNSNFNNCNFINNNAIEGGALYIINGPSNFTNCYFSGNAAEANVTLYHGGIVGIGVGGAVYILSGASKFDNCNFENNRANGTGGAVDIDIDSKNTNPNKGSGIFINCNFNNNQAEYGGAISIYKGSSTITNSQFTNNKAEYGAGIYTSENSDNFSNCLFNNNNAYCGAGFFTSYGSGTFNNCSLTNNKAVRGGGTYFFNTKANFIDSTFTRNTASEQGGAISILGESGNFNSCTFTDNTADSGNAIYTTASIYLNNRNNINIEDITLGDGAYINTKLTITASNHTYGESIPITINLSINNTKPSTPVEIFVNNSKYDLDLVNGVGVINLDNLDPGVYVASVSYNGISDSVTFSVNKRNISNEVNLTYKGSIKDFNVNVDFPENTTGTLTVTIDGINYTENIVNNNVKFNIKGEFKNNQDIVVTYSGDKANEEFTKEYTLNLNISSVNLNINVSNGIYGESVPITINLSKDSVPLTAKVNVTVNNTNYLVNVTNGVGVLNLTDLNLGSYTVTVSYEDASDTATFSVKRNITINDVNIIVENNDNNSSIVVKFPQNVTGNVIITVDNENYTANIVNGNATFNINRTFSEKENLSIVYSGDKLNTGFNGTVSISFDNFELIANNVTKYYHNATQFYASLISNGAPLVGQNVTITINGQEYSRTTNENGTVNLTINSNPGIYNVITSYTDPDTGETINITSTITVLSTVSGENIVKYYRNATRYYATFLDNNGNPLANTVVRFNIHGVFYNATTDNEGVASLGINLLPNDYIITAYNPINDQAFSNNITVLSTLDTSNIVKYFRNGTQFTAKVLNGVGDVVAGSIVTFNIHGKLYDRITDSNGVATLSINLDPGDYTITAYNNITGQSVGNNVKVLSVLTGADLTKNYNQDASYIVHFVDSQGNAVAGKTITFNINGKFYTRSTDSNGDARLAINLIPGRYVITASAEVDGGNAITSNIINVL